MDWNKAFRQTHRWLAVAFTLAFLANIVVNLAGAESVALAVGMGTIPLILLLMVTGIYLFALPYAARWRRGRVDPG